MPLNPDYILAPSPQGFFIDVQTGLPLSSGLVYCLSDVNRTQLKPVFMLAGSPPNYTYVELPNPIVLSAVGTYTDNNGNDIIPYWFCLDGLGNPELYYLVVQDMNGVPQFTRSAWPNFIEDVEPINNPSLQNFIPNGQFLNHYLLPANPLSAIPAGQVTQATTVIGGGGWVYERTPGSTAIDNISFQRFVPYTGNPTSSPRYAITIACTSPSGTDTFKRLGLRFIDVNKFASTTQQYTLSFTAQTNIPPSVELGISIVYNFGTSNSTAGVPTPSATVVTPITDVTISSGFAIYNVPFVFGTNPNAVIGSDDTDYVELAIVFNPTQVFNVTLTDFVLTTGNVVITSFPEQTNAQMLDESIAGWIPNPNPNGFDLHLAIRLSQTGFVYDHSEVGDVLAESVSNSYTNSISTITNRLLADGNQYYSQGYSPLGIPFSRLWTKYYNSTTGLPLYGTGSSFLTAYISSLTGAPGDQIRINCNSQGTPTSITDGSNPTGFTFATITPGLTYAASTSGVLNGYLDTAAGSGNVILYVKPGASSSTFTSQPGAGTSGFTMSTIRNITVTSAAVYRGISVFKIQPIAGTGLSGDYFTYTAGSGTSYYMWFTVDGSTPSDPAPGGTGVKVALLSTYQADEVGAIVASAISGYQISTVVCTAASIIPPSSWFKVFSITPSATNVGYYIWYNINGSLDPAPGGGLIGIKVTVASTATAIQVAAATQKAINSTYFATPNLQGLFLRGNDPNSVFDQEAFLRTGQVQTISGANVGTLETDELLSHLHTFPTSALVSGVAGTGGMLVLGSNTQSTTAVGGFESRPFNNSVQWVVKY